MKKLILIVSICLFTLTGFSKSVPYNYYWNSKSELSFCKKIRLHRNSMTAILENGKKVVVPISEVKMYRVNGKTYERLPIYENNKKTNKYAFMQFVTTRAGLRLFKYTTWNELTDSQAGTYLGVTKVERYCIYKGDQFWLAVTERNYPTVLDFFKIRYK